MPKCPIHHIELTCASCNAIARGRKGGAKRSAKQSEAARANLAKVNEAKKRLAGTSPCKESDEPPASRRGPSSARP